MVMYGSFFLLYRSTSRTIKEDYYDGGQSMINNRKRIIIISVLSAAAVVAAVVCVVMTRRIRGGNPTGEALSQNVNPIESSSRTEEPTVYVDNTVDIIDVNSKTRPFAVSVNNTPVAVQVQTGLNKAYIVYELPTESYTCRLLALFKVEDSDVTDEAPQEIVGSGNVSQTDTVIGTIRSARHNFLDFCFESDAIFVHFGGSTYAESDEAKTGINWINGFYNSAYYWRRNPEGLATEHTAYTSLYRLKSAVQEKGFNAEAENASDTVLLNYDVSDVDLSKREDSVSASSVYVPYSSYQYTTFTYDAASGNYLRFASGEPSLDHETGEQFNTKNIIVQKITHSMMDDNYCWNLHTVGRGEGYYITNGYAVPIQWSKPDRYSKTVYTYADGTEINVSDGRTYIEVSDVTMTVEVE